MARVRASRAAFLIICAGAFALAASSYGAVITLPPLVLQAGGSFSPNHLPRHRYAPIELKGQADLRTLDGSLPPPLTEVVLEFDRDGLLSTRGLPTCRPAQIVHATVAKARRKCQDAIVGTGHVNGIILINGRWTKARAPLTLFNGPPNGALATVVAHAQPVSLPDEIYVVSVPIERAHGEYRYRATVKVPEIAEGNGLLSHIDGTIDRRYEFQGLKHSYISARCSDHSLAVHGTLMFESGILIEGTIEKPCVQIP